MSTTFANSINSNPIYAERAEKDAAGNDISTTYATKSELPEGVPAVTSSDNNKVLKASYSEGVASYSWQTESGGGGAQADWTEGDPEDPSYIQNKPAVLGMVAGSNVTITEGASTITIAATDTTYSAGSGIDITSGTISVDTTTVAMKTDIPTVPTTDQTYNSSSTNPQSGTAVAGAIAGVSQVPAVTSSDDSKVLTASYTGGVASYSWQTAQGGGGGGSSNVTTADKQINVAVNGTGVPMQLNLLNPVTNWTTANLGTPTVSVATIQYDGQTYYNVNMDWVFNKSAVRPLSASDSLWPITVTVANDLLFISGNDRTYVDPPGTYLPGMAASMTLEDASTDAPVGYSISGRFPGFPNTSAYPPTQDDLKFTEGTYGPDSLSFTLQYNQYASANTIRFRIQLAGSNLDPVTGSPVAWTQADAQSIADIVSQHASDFVLTADSSTATKYTSYIGSTSISGQTKTADSTYSGVYRYDFTAGETASLVPGTYLVQVDGPSGTGNQTTTVYLYKDGYTGYNYYTSNGKPSYLNSSGSRREMFLMKVDENTTAIGTKVNYGNFTMVRLG